MTFLDFEIDEKDLAAAKFLGETRRGLVHAIIEAKRENPKISQSAIAKKIGIDKGSLSKILNGNGNMTLRTLAEIAWAIGADPEVHYCNGTEGKNSNYSWKTICGAEITKPNTVIWQSSKAQSSEGKSRNPVYSVRVKHAV